MLVNMCWVRSLSNSCFACSDSPRGPLPLLHVLLGTRWSCYSAHSDTVNALDVRGRYMFLLVFQVRELVNDFYGSRYASCLSHLTKLRPMLELDLHAHVHLNTLYAAVRSPTSPYTCFLTCCEQLTCTRWK